ncbi:serine hydrolase domain-containing protein [Serratia marcescens]|uniref:serine hydrolase domain-containing protein n=1 Tax=Serratia marcescens TaxID=615 RepID=UPI000E3E00A6|nr:serine hydrolase domain-containing protein [Serratia marcescens]RFT82451.1 class A beta-lactamase-related serine hydrolase [Serratia marcescens]TFZ84696.1 class A beta-lactamase-related serine hydrolase [Serratia marcescens]BBG69414.1 serine hydrolase [Serratia marcescens]
MNEYGSTGNAIDGAIEQALREKRLVGAVVLVAQGGEIVYRRAAGMADREAGKPMALNTLFRLASVSKPIVSTAALALMAQGAMRLDDPITRWLPNFRPRLADGTQPLLTLWHLMTHTAGLSYRFFQPEGGFYARLGVSDGMDDASVSLQENVRRIACAPLLAPPGAVIEQASGLPLAQAVNKWVTGPLAMTDTDFLAVDAARLAAAYADHPGEPRRLRQPDRLPFIDGSAGFLLSPARALDPLAYASGGAGMVGSAEDFLRLLETLRQGGGQVLPAEWVTALTTNQIGDLPMPFWPGRGFGLGITVLKDPVAARTPESVGSWRMGGTYGHSWFVDPVRQLSVVVFTNTALEGMSGAFVGEICQAVYAATGAMQCA